MNGEPNSTSPMAPEDAILLIRRDLTWPYTKIAETIESLRAELGKARVRETISDQVHEETAKALETLTNRLKQAQRERDEWNRGQKRGLGWKYHEPTEDEIKSGSYYQYEPDITWETVHNALMGMSEEEWAKFGYLVSKEISIASALNLWTQIVIRTLKTPLPTLVSCFLKATKGRKT